MKGLTRRRTTENGTHKRNLDPHDRYVEAFIIQFFSSIYATGLNYQHYPTRKYVEISCTGNYRSLRLLRPAPRRGKTVDSAICIPVNQYSSKRWIRHEQAWQRKSCHCTTFNTPSHDNRLSTVHDVIALPTLKILNAPGTHVVNLKCQPIAKSLSTLREPSCV